MPAEYIPRLIDKTLAEDLKLFGAVVITGPKWCGKTTTSRRLARTTVSLQDEVQYRNYRMMADIDPKLMLKGEKPLLFDEWQSIPEIWDAVRYDADESGLKGQFILTGSATLDSMLDSERIRHSGAGRIVRVQMRTMSTYESGKSTGEVSLGSLFDGGSRVSGVSDMGIRDVARELVRGGWPETLGMDDRQAHAVVSGYCEMLLNSNVETDGGRRHDPGRMRAVLRSLSRNSAMSVPATTILKDVNTAENTSMSINTLYDYLNHLKTICVTDDLPAWSVRLRSKSAIRTSDTRHLTDPAIAAYFLGAGEEDLLSDMETLGLLFESMVVRDLRVYAQSLEGSVSHYRDSDGLEVDAIVHLWNGRWGAVEIKLSETWADKAAENLLKLKSRLDPKATPPSFLMVVTAAGVAHTRPDGVHVVPIGCLRNRGSPDQVLAVCPLEQVHVPLTTSVALTAGQPSQIEIPGILQGDFVEHRALLGERPLRTFVFCHVMGMPFVGHMPCWSPPSPERSDEVVREGPAGSS